MQLDDMVSQYADINFAEPDTVLDGVANDRTARVLANAADITLIIDPDDIVSDASFGLESVYEGGGEQWKGRLFADVVTPECKGKVEKLLAAARDGKKPSPREINHQLASGSVLPVRYTAVSLGEDGRVIAFGRDMSGISILQQKLMASQLTVEREFARLRAAESRYRMIFQLSDIPYILVDAATLRACDINPAARRILGFSNQRIEDAKIASLFDNSSAEVLHQLLRASVDDGSDEDIKTVLRGGEAITIAASHFRQEQKSYLLLRLSSDSGNVLAFSSAAELKFLNIIDRITDAFVITNASREVIAVNSAFVNLIGLSSHKEAEGRLIDSWFDRPNVDCSVLMANVREHGKVRRFATVLRTSYDQSENVEIAAVQTTHRGETVYGFVIRSMSAALATSEAEGQSLSQSNEQVASLVGHMPLKDIVRQTTEMIEKLCIETALDLTKGNRALAAQMLGLSRQSLYAKLGKSKSGDDQP
ncbi:MAG: transcriptional regulator PpsR [Pseudomonadota bacterium]